MPVESFRKQKLSHKCKRFTGITFVNDNKKSQKKSRREQRRSSCLDVSLIPMQGIWGGRKEWERRTQGLSTTLGWWKEAPMLGRNGQALESSSCPIAEPGLPGKYEVSAQTLSQHPRYCTGGCLLPASLAACQEAASWREIPTSNLPPHLPVLVKVVSLTGRGVPTQLVKHDFWTCQPGQLQGRSTFDSVAWVKKTPDPVETHLSGCRGPQQNQRVEGKILLSAGSSVFSSVQISEFLVLSLQTRTEGHLWLSLVWLLQAADPTPPPS